MHLGKDQEFSTYSVRQNEDSIKIIQVTEQRDLGVTIDNKLKFVLSVYILPLVTDITLTTNDTSWTGIK